MNTGELLGWVGAITLSAVIVAAGVLAVVSIVREIVNPGPRVQRAKSKRIDVS